MCIDTSTGGATDRYLRLQTVYFTIKAWSALSVAAWPRREIYDSGRALRSRRLKTRLRLDEGARTAFLLIHAVLRLHTRKVHAELYTLLPRKCTQVWDFTHGEDNKPRHQEHKWVSSALYAQALLFHAVLSEEKCSFLAIRCASRAVFFSVHCECIDTWLRRSSRGVRCGRFICGLTPRRLLTDALNKLMSALSSNSGWLTWLDSLWFNYWNK